MTASGTGGYIDLAEISDQLRELCGAYPDRHPGSPGNEQAVGYIDGVLKSLGIEVERLPFDVVAWTAGASSMSSGATVIPVLPGPFSLAADVEGEVITVDSEGLLAGLDASGRVLVVHGALASEQLTPRTYPWYTHPGHVKVLDALEAARPLAIVAITGLNPGTTGAMSPFPLIEEVGFSIPSCYAALRDEAAIMGLSGKRVRVRIESTTAPSGGTQLIGRMRPSDGAASGQRVIVAGHVDSKPGTPGALDNATGVVTMLAVAALLADSGCRHFVEFIPFNGEDHTQSPGEVAYLERYGDLGDVALMVNVDCAGLVGAPTAVSLYGVNGEIADAVASALSSSATVVEGPQWPASDHMIFSMRGVPAIALATTDLDRAMSEITHTERDVPDLVDPALLLEAANFIAQVLRAI